MSISDERLAVPDAQDLATTPRQRGRPRRISRDRIVSAARSVAPEALTMQAVADVLGVDPKALNYHVGDRDALRELVALDVFESALTRVAMPAGGDWRSVLRIYCAALRDAVVELGVLATYFRLPPKGIGALAPVERVLQELVDAGFSVVDAGHALRLVTELGHAAGREAVFLAQSTVHPNVDEVATALGGAVEGTFPMLRQVVAARGDDTDDEAQLLFSLDVVVTGLEQMLSHA
ncbi:MAG TPA: TetR/AcrR family transcriptional regulator C-terminal domain-containing protein [Mycobacterium sp.]|nr:TetR/AcrR family transcriptional regulator C-terminal domain-containing protein [Mycobacterium sp.]